MKNFIKLLLLLPLLISCVKLPDVPSADFSFGGGTFIVNEGNFLAGNGSLSFYSYDSLKIFNDIFSGANGRPLGDVPNSIVIHSDKAYIVVNNSGKIEVINHSTLLSVATIPGLISPRNMAVVNDGKAYVSSMFSDSVAILNLYSNTISGYINIGRSSETIKIAGTNAYISNWMNGNKIMVVNTLNNAVIDSIEVGTEPESMVFDRFNRLWVLCTGGWQKQNPAELDLIDTRTNEILKKFPFPTLQNSPSCIQIDAIGQNIYYLDKGVRQMSIDAQELPVTTLIAEAGGYFYKLAINPVNSDIFITDAANYIQNGNLLIYKNNGVQFAKHATGIIPGSMCFKIIINPVQKNQTGSEVL